LSLFELLGYRREGRGVGGSLLGRQIVGISRTMVPNAVEFSHEIILNRVVRKQENPASLRGFSR